MNATLTPLRRHRGTVAAPVIAEPARFQQTEADADWHVPAPSGLPWGPRRIDPPVVDDRPMACAAMEASDRNVRRDPSPRVVVLRRAYRRAFWQGVITGMLWALVLAFAAGWIVGKVHALAEVAEPVPAVQSPAAPATAWDARA